MDRPADGWGMRRLLRPLVSFISWHRRAVGATLAAAAVVLLAATLRSPAPSTEVVVITDARPAGHVLMASDLGVRSLPDQALPDDRVTDTSEIIGRTLVAPVSAGTIAQVALLASDHPADDGRAVVPIGVGDDALRSLLSPGDMVSLIAQGPEDTEVVSSDARVVALPTGPDDTSQLGSASGHRSAMILVDVASKDAAVVASLGQGEGLSIVLGAV